MWLDGKEAKATAKDTKAILQQTASNIDSVKCM